MINKNITNSKKLSANEQDVINTYMEELKMVDKAPRYFYSNDGGVNTIIF